MKPYPPRKQQFKGNLYLLIGGSTASATSDFAAWVKELDLATIVGTETGGSYLGNTSNWEFMIELPQTKLRLHLPLARYLINGETKELGRGVIPDYIVPTTTQDKLNDIDTQLKYTLQLIRNNTSAGVLTK
ncbi:MAG: S41 family peptidase [Bacteroidota bacterium]